jgi:ribonuclease P protein component
MQSAGLPREARLRRPGDFAALRSAADAQAAAVFICAIAATNSVMPGSAWRYPSAFPSARSSATASSAAARIVSACSHQLPAIDLMVMAREQAAGVPGPQLLAEIDLLWKKLLATRTRNVPESCPPLKRSTRPPQLRVDLVFSDLPSLTFRGLQVSWRYPDLLRDESNAHLSHVRPVRRGLLPVLAWEKDYAPLPPSRRRQLQQRGNADGSVPTLPTDGPRQPASTPGAAGPPIPSSPAQTTSQLITITPMCCI